MKKYIIILFLFFPLFSFASGIDEYNKLNLHCDSGTSTITDSSESAHTITVVNQCTSSTAQYKFSPGSCNFDGTTDYLYPSASSADFTFGTGDFTVDYWWRISAAGVQGAFQQSATASGLYAGTLNTLAVGTDTGNVFRIYSNNLATNSVSTYSTNTWYHIALIRSGTTTKLYKDGTAIITLTGDSTNYTGTYITVGCYYSTSYCTNGYIDEFRVSKGIARWTTNFTPPTSPYSSEIPTITSFTPTSGTTGETLTLTGTNFTSTATMSLWDSHSLYTMDNYTYTATTNVEAHVPDGLINNTNYNVIYTNANGTATSSQTFHFHNNEGIAADNSRYTTILLIFISTFAIFDFMRRIFIKK